MLQTMTAGNLIPFTKRQPRALPPPLPPSLSPPAKRLVTHALIAAQNLDLSTDQCYMPLEGGTSLQEAYHFLRQHNYILIQGGRIDRDQDGGNHYHLTMWEQKETHTITVCNVRQLMILNYP